MRTIDLVQAINDAVALQNVLMPLLKEAISTGAVEVSDEEVAAAKATLGETLDRVEAKAEKMS
jgi:hypothetical protein